MNSELKKNGKWWIKNVFANFFFWLFINRIQGFDKKCYQLFYVLKNVDFRTKCQMAKSAIFQRDLALSISVQSGSTIAQINCLDKYNWMKQDSFEYLENWSFFLIKFIKIELSSL